jgi:hypothetical protein
MTTATAEKTQTTERQELYRLIESLSNSAIFQVKGYIERLREEEELKAIDAEIAALEAKYGTTPNAETIAAMEAAEAGIGELVTLDQIQAECNALR